MKQLSARRNSQSLRDLLAETDLSVRHLIAPLFVCSGKNRVEKIVSMPGIERLSMDRAVKKVKELYRLGIRAVILFGIADKKDARGSGAWAKDGIIQRTIAEIKSAVPEILVIADTCFCEYTSHGHCGVLQASRGKAAVLDHAATRQILALTAVTQAEAGADVIAPSGMVDGMVGAIRQALDESGLQSKLILSYAVKYASAFYGPFREAAQGAPQFGDRRTYQMDFRNAREARLEAKQDLHEGADILMVKPALAYLDIVHDLRQQLDVPIAAYNVSGEYAMVQAAAQKKWVDGEKIVIEILTSIRRAGADWIISYHTESAARLLHQR